MKVLIHDYSGHPFQVQLSRRLASLGYSVVHVFCATFTTPKGNLSKSANDPDTFKIVPVNHKRELKKYSYITRVFQEREYGRQVSRLILGEKPDLVISGNAPLDAQNIIKKTCNKTQVKFIFWVQDFYSIAIERFIKKPVIGFLASRYYRFLEIEMLRSSDGVVVISDDFIPTLDQWEVDLDKVTTIENWAPIDEIPQTEKNNKWSVSSGLSDSINIIYTGTLGLKHNPELLVDLSLEFKDNENIKVVVASEGIGADYLKRKQVELDLENLVLMGFQPFDVYPEVLGSADILISVLEEDAGQFSVPSKVLSYLCAGKPLLLSVPLDNLSSKIVTENKAGLVSAPGDRDGFIKSAILLCENKDLRDGLGHNARRYAERTFNIEKIANDFVDLIELLGNER